MFPHNLQPGVPIQAGHFADDVEVE
jgi:hypothetical protein